MKVLLVCLICIGINQSCCSYLPFIDYNMMNDYAKEKYFIEKDNFLISNDKIIIKVKADVFLPNRRRSVKQKKIFVKLYLDIPFNYYKDTLRMNLNEEKQLEIDDSKQIITGFCKGITSDNDNSELLIFGNTYFVKNNHNFKSDVLLFEFLYPYKDFNKENHRLRINFKNLFSKYTVPLKLNEVTGIFKMKNE